MNDVLRKRTLFRHPLAAVGGALTLAGGFLFIILLLIDFTTGAENPYSSLVTFVFVPAIITVGVILFLIASWLQVKSARARGERVKFNLSIDPTDPNYLRNLWLFLGLTALLVLIVSYSGYRAYESTDSVAFCGQTCHEVMEPQYVTYLHSPHARVACVECHIGPGASFYVRSKLDGTRQLFRTALNTFERPIQTPVENLRPAQETCEGCHWPEQFWGSKYISRTYYRTDSANSPWTINMLLRVGGGNPRTGRSEGIHWHMLTANRLQYIATDEKRQEIPWVRVVRQEGDTIIYAEEGAEMPNLEDPNVELRTFDCMDCHNRPSHKFLAPATAMNIALSARQISPALPYIRTTGLDLLNAEYETKPQALAAIESGLKDYYSANYPQVASTMQAEINQAVHSLQQIYALNFFPEMKTDYRARENNLSHFVNDGCFRCHAGNMVSAQGDTISHDCQSCHLIVAQGSSEDLSQLAANIAGVNFQHPEDIGEAWLEVKCTECHTPEQGY